MMNSTLHAVRWLCAEMVVGLMLAFSHASTFQWNGSVSSVWSEPTNWNPTGTPSGISAGPAPLGSKWDHRLNVNNGSASVLIYDSSGGTTSYGGLGIRGLVIGSGASKASMVITGGTFDTTSSNLQDAISSSSTANESLLGINGGTYRCGTLQLGLNNPSRNTLTVSRGLAVIDRVDFNVQNGIATLNLDGGKLQIKSFKSSTTTPGSSSNAIHFNGGTLVAGETSNVFLPDLLCTSSYVKPGGLNVDTNGCDIIISEPLLDAGGGLSKFGAGKLTLSSPATYTGGTVVSAGTLALGSGGGLAATATMSLAQGSVFDVSAVSSYRWPVATQLISAGGGLVGGAAIDLGAAAVVLDMTPNTLSGDVSQPALTVSAGSLVVNGTMTVNNRAAAPLGDGTYALISMTGGTISGSPTFSGTIGGQGIKSGSYCYLKFEPRGLMLVVQSPAPTTTTLERDTGVPSSSIYGDLLRFRVRVAPATASGIVELYDGGVSGVLVGSAKILDGVALISVPETSLAPGSHANLVARYLGALDHLASVSSPLSPMQSVALKPLVIQNAAALDKYYDASTSATVVGALTGVESGDEVVLLASGFFSSAAAGKNVPVTSTSQLTGVSASRYTLVQPTGLTANIIAANVWTGGTGGTGTNFATGVNYSPTAVTTAPYTAIFNGLDPSTADLTLASAIGGGVGTSGMVFGFAGNQVNSVVINGSTGATVRVASMTVAAGAGSVIFQGTIPFTLGGASANSNHMFINDSSKPLMFQNTGNWQPGGSGNTLRSLFFSGSGDITVASSIVSSVPSRISLTKSGVGRLTLSGNNGFSGGTTILEGGIVAQSATALGSGAVICQGTLDLGAGAVTYTGLSSSLSGAGMVNVALGVGSATTILNGNYSEFTGAWNLGTSAASGAGKVQMNGADHPAATIRVLDNATLYTTSGNHRAALILNGGNTGESLGQLRLEGGAIWSGSITIAGDITGAGDGHIGANTGTGIIRGNINETGGARSLVKEGDGTIVLSGSNNFTGVAAVNDGVLLLERPGSLVGSVTVASGATFGGSGSVGGGISVDAGGTLDPGYRAPDTLTVQGPLALAGTTLFRVDRSSFPLCGRIQSDVSLAFGGTLKVVNQGPALKMGDRLQLFSAPAFSGSFASILLPPLGYDLMWDRSKLDRDGSLTVVSAASLDHPVITLARSTFYQQIFGIGGNFCQGEQNTLVDYNRYNEMFGSSGLNMSFIRLSTAHELIEPSFARFDANNVTTIREFRARQPYGRVMLTTWTPPESLKSTNSPYQGTLAKNAAGSYRYADYAAWWTRALQFYQNQSVLPDYVSIQNECDFTPTPPTSGAIPAYVAGCYLNSSETSTRAGYPQALAAVRSAFAGVGLGSMKMIGPDTTAIAGDKVKTYLDNIPSGQIDAIAHHLYHDSPGSSGVSNLSRLQSQYPNWVMPKFMTELNPHDTYEAWDASQPSWMKLAVTMHNVFSFERANTYMVWSSMYGFIDRITGVPNNANYYALAHFSRFVNAGNWRVAASSSDPDLLVTHYRHYGGSGISDRQILVLINTSAKPKHTTVGTAASWATNPAQRSWQVYQTADDGSATKRITMTELELGPWLAGDRRLVLPPYSLTTALVNTGSLSSSYTQHQAWRLRHFGTLDPTGSAADLEDPNQDGESNLLEFATGQNPFDATTMSPVVKKNGGQWSFTYTRSKAAVLDGVVFNVAWSDTLASGSWSSAGIVDQNPAPISQTDETETLQILIPVGSGRRFVHLEVTKP